MEKLGTRRIETPRLILRRFTLEDAEDMFQNWAADPEVTRFLSFAPHESAEVSRGVLEGWIANYEEGDYFNWAIEWRETGRVLGNISVGRLEEKTEAADIGYCMSRAFWGREIMTEALIAVMEYLFDRVGLNRLTACHDVNNPRSGRVMEKAGMRREGVGRQAGRNNQGLCDLAWYAALRGEWTPPRELRLELKDREWPFTYTDHDRRIVRAIVTDGEGYFYFVRVRRDDDFGPATLIETSGGGVEPGEDLESAIRRELREELGAEVEILGRLGLVSDYYNLIHRHNLNHYFLCRVRSFGERHLTRDELEDFHLATLKLTWEEAVREYEDRADTRLGRLLRNRELPVLRRAKEILEGSAKP